MAQLKTEQRRAGALARLPLLLFIIGAVVVSAALLAQASPAEGGAPAGQDVLPVTALVGVTSRLGSEVIPFEGTVTIDRSDPYLDGGVQVVDLAIDSLSLAGTSLIGTVAATESPTLPSVGEFRSLQPLPNEFPASSFFDVFFEVSVPGSPSPTITLHNVAAIHLVPDLAGSEVPLYSWPPFGVTYAATPIPCVPLIPSEPAEVCVTMVAVTFGEQGGPTGPIVEPPTFSVAPHGPTGFDPGALLGLDPVATTAVPCLQLGLTPTGCVGDQDNVDALSFGVDFLPGELLVADLPVAFSVANGADGTGGSAVAEQAACDPPQPPADIFVSQLQGDNALAFDGDGLNGSCPTASQLGLFEGNPSDDVDALTDQSPSFVDANGDGAPEGTVFFSLSDGSASLQAFNRSAGDILWTTGHVQPGVFAFASALGLQPGDDIDALCVGSDNDTVYEPAIDHVAFSLTAGSPTLAALDASAADILVPGPQVVVQAEELGLATGDDLNALACGAAFELPPPPTETPTQTPQTTPTQTAPVTPTTAAPSPTSVSTPVSTAAVVTQLPQAGSGSRLSSTGMTGFLLAAGLTGVVGGLALLGVARRRRLRA
ncbi:MAG: hypothetical protein WBD55_11965 [Dehalococcoidia bacterium]